MNREDRLYRLIMVESDAAGQFPVFEPAGNITDIMEVERTPKEAKAIFQAAADKAFEQYPCTDDDGADLAPGVPA